MLQVSDEVVSEGTVKVAIGAAGEIDADRYAVQVGTFMFEDIGVTTFSCLE